MIIYLPGAHDCGCATRTREADGHETDNFTASITVVHLGVGVLRGNINLASVRGIDMANALYDVSNVRMSVGLQPTNRTTHSPLYGKGLYRHLGSAFRLRSMC
jgi:hypothetical protein